ncbi:MAG: arsenic efflux protein [Lachnospiraceae bacterium]|nr:arsenic efflux protein [Lachnospiraceae bacterium]
MGKIWDIGFDTVCDSVKLLPFLFLTYLAMEYLEHYTGEKTARAIQRAGRFGPFPGALLGLLPQCGFSAAAAGLYAGRVITTGTLLAVFLATSDEMLPILISEGAPASMVARILAVKFLFGMLFGFLVDFFHRRPVKTAGDCGAGEWERDAAAHGEMCEHGILRPAFFHTLQVFAFLFLITFVLNGAVAWLGEESFRGFLLARPVVGEMLTAFFGLLPNCAASVAVTRFYLAGAMSAGAMTAGLLSGAGVGLLVLFRVNRDRRQNGKIVGLLYVSAVAGGLLVSGLGIVF